MCALPAPIKKLDENVVNRIAAGEVIQRPANALKELLENSLDAKSTNISVILKCGGLKLLQIQDNGTGIRKDDLEIVCRRFTTSKLSQFEDLSSIATFGFRGEALASISHVAHLTITTKTSDSPCAYKAIYKDEDIKGTPKPCAGNQGTIITVEDLFYNVPTRKKAFKSPSEEHSRVADVMSKYSIHNPSVGFTLKKHGENLSDVKTNTNSTHVENIKLIYGNNIARELLEIEASDDIFNFRVKGYISNVNYSTKKQIFILFINNRLVDSQGLRKAIENVYSVYLPKGSHPFLYLSLTLDPKTVDVNVHPTKHEVHFLHEDSIIENTRQAIEKKLLGANTSRVFYTQAKLPGVDVELTSAVLEKTAETSSQKNMVRTDSSIQKLDKFLTTRKEDSSQKEKDESTPNEQDSQRPVTLDSVHSKKSHRRVIELGTVLKLRKQAEMSCSLGLRDILANHTFVGCATLYRALIQHNVSLYLVRTQTLIEELFYQIMLLDFGNFGIIKFSSPLPLREVLLLGLDNPKSGWSDEDGEKEEVVEKMSTLLLSKSRLLQDYFSLEIDDYGRILCIPLLLDGYCPDLYFLPLYFLRLACDVDWSAEMPCFDTFCRETAKFYSFISESNDKDGHDWKWITEHILYPAIKSLLPPKNFADDETFLQLTTLPDLYKVFERC